MLGGAVISSVCSLSCDTGSPSPAQPSPAASPPLPAAASATASAAAASTAASSAAAASADSAAAPTETASIATASVGEEGGTPCRSGKPSAMRPPPAAVSSSCIACTPETTRYEDRSQAPKDPVGGGGGREARGGGGEGWEVAVRASRSGMSAKPRRQKLISKGVRPYQFSAFGLAPA